MAQDQAVWDGEALVERILNTAVDDHNLQHVKRG